MCLHLLFFCLLHHLLQEHIIKLDSFLIKEAYPKNPTLYQLAS